MTTDLMAVTNAFIVAEDIDARGIIGQYPRAVIALRDEVKRIRAVLDRIAERTSSDDPCRHLVQIARDALKDTE